MNREPAFDGSLWSGLRVGVTGATGFLGTHVTRLLVESGAEVTILIRDRVPETSLQTMWAGAVNVVHGDITDETTMERMIGEYDLQSMVHLAAQSQVGVANANPLSTFESNIKGTWTVLEVCRRAPSLQALVVASSDKAYGAQPTLPYDESMPLDGRHPYDASKSCADTLALTYAESFGLNVAITRCGNFFGPGDINWQRIVPGTFRSLLRNERPQIRSDGTMIRDYLYVEDGAGAYLTLLEHLHANDQLAGEAFNFSYGTPYSVLEIVDLIRDSINSPIEPDVLGIAKAEIQEQHLSSSKAQEILGWAPRFSIEDAFARTADWYRNALS